MIENKILKARETSGRNPVTFMVQALNVNYDQNGTLIPLQDEVDSIERRLAEKQPLHAALTSISGLTTSADKMIYTTSANSYATTTITSLARNLLDDTTQQAMRTTINATSPDDTIARAIADQNGNVINTTYSTKAETIKDIDDPLEEVEFFNTGSSGNMNYHASLHFADNADLDHDHKYIDMNDVAVNQKMITTNGSFPLLLVSNAGQSKDIRNSKVNFAKDVTLNPSTKTITAATFSGELSGNATTATTLKTERLISVSLSTASTSGTKFNGSKDITIGVKDTLQISNGGTGLTSSPSLLVDLGSTTAANILQASPKPGISGTLDISHGGTGLTSSPSLLVNLGSTTADNVLKASPRPGVTGTLPVGQGGTGQTSVADIKAGKDGSGNTITSTYLTKTDAGNTYVTKASGITGLAASGTTITYTKGDGTTGTISTQDTDQSVKQESNSSNTNYPILFKTSTATTTTTTTVYFKSGITVNPSTSTITATNFSGTASKATADGNGDNIRSTYIKSLSVSSGTMTITKGDGSTSTAVVGTTISDASTTTKGIVKIGSNISVSSGTISLSKDNVTSALGYTPPESNTDQSVKQTNSTSNTAYPILLKNGTGTGTITNSVLFNSGITINPSTSTVTATNFAGTASKATGDSNGDNIRSTYVKSVTVSNGTMTVTKGDGTSTTATVSTTISDASTTVKGIVKVGSNISVSSGTISLSSSNVTSALGFTPISSSGTAAKADQLSTTRTIDGVDFNGSAAISHYGTASGAASATTKSVTCTGFKLVTGSRIVVYFPDGHTGTSLSLNVNSTGAKTALYNGSAITAAVLEEKGVYEFVYDGTQFRLINDPSGTLTSKMSNYVSKEDTIDTANSANRLNTTATINGLLYTGATNVVSFAICSTAAGTAQKAVTINNFSTSLVSGLQATIKFTVANTAANPTLKINSLTAKPIWYRGIAIPAGALALNSTYTFVYTGSAWEIVGSVVWAE